MDWRDRWEDDAQTEYEEFCAMPLAKLLDRVARKKLGSHHMIWSAIAAKGDLLVAGWPLFRFASSGAQCLDRYHSAKIGPR